MSESQDNIADALSSLKKVPALSAVHACSPKDSGDWGFASSARLSYKWKLGAGLKAMRVRA